MVANLLTQIADTLTKRPEYGIISSMLTITISATDVLQLLGVILGLFIAVITAILKVIELRDKLREKRRKDSEGYEDNNKSDDSED